MEAEKIAGVVGLLLAVGAALDFAIRAERKTSFARWLSARTVAGSDFGYKGTALLDAIFGEGLWSQRALLRYAFISFTSICVSFAFALLTSPPEEIDNNIRLFPQSVSALALSVLLVCVTFAIVGDFASYAITRLFIRTVDQYKRPVVSLGLVTADIVVSLSLFFLAFSFARVLSYLLVFSFGTVPNIEAKSSFIPELLAHHVEKSRLPQENLDITVELATLVASAESQRQLDAIATLAKKIEFPSGKAPPTVSYVVSRTCLDKSKREDIYAAASDTAGLGGEYARLSGAGSADEVEENIRSSAVEMLMRPADCSFHVITITRAMPGSALLAEAGLGNTYLASLERTLFDAYSVTAFKMAPYVKFDPFASTGDFVSSLNIMLVNSFLGMSPPEDRNVELVSAFPDTPQSAEGALNVPFSPMVASSLTSSLFFVLYLAASGLTLLRNRVKNAILRTLPEIDTDRAIFTSFALAASLVVTAVWGLTVLTAALWGVLF